MSAERLLDCLAKVRRTGPDRWLACCPAHEDKGPSLSIRETDDGRVLIHCFAGCSVHDVVSAVGLQLHDLFPPRLGGQHMPPERRPFPTADAFRAVAFECLVVAAAGTAMSSGNNLSETDRDRLVLAVQRVNAAVTAAMPEIRGGHHA